MIKSIGLEQYKNYKIAELYNIFGVDWRYKLGLCEVPKVFNKPIITEFNNFNNDTKLKYIKIAKCIKQANHKENIKVWATGSRIHGCWKTDEEAELSAKKYNHLKPKYSDYDFITDAKVIPCLTHLDFRTHGYQTPNIQHKILIPVELYN
jgi:hypothetical protein